jgi:adenylate cyclase
MSLLSEIKRRSVAKVGIAYAATGWILVDIASVLFPIFGAPTWVLRVLTTLVILGFPVALIISWIYELTPEGLQRTSDLPTETPPRAGGRRLDYVIVGLLVFALATFVLDRWVLVRHEGAAPAKTAAAVPEPVSGSGPAQAALTAVAVLPFLNLSSDPEQEFFADGLTEELLNRLARIPSLRVAARTSSFHFKDRNPELREVGSALHVGTVVEGSVRRSTDRLRVSAQLIDVASGYELWSETYDRQLTDVFAIQDDIIAEIVRALSVHFGDVETDPTRARPVDPEVYQLVLRGRFHWNKRSPDALAEAAELFHEATQRDPEYAPAYAGLADTYLSQYDYGMLSWEDSTVKARAAASKALELDDRLAEAHVSLAHILMHEWAWQKAESEFHRAMELNPSYVVAYHWYALCLTALGRVDEAVAAMQQA